MLVVKNIYGLSFFELPGMKTDFIAFRYQFSGRGFKLNSRPFVITVFR